MFNTPPPTREHWVYDDPSGVPEPAPYPRAWRPRVPRRRPTVTVVGTAARKHVRFAHREA